MTELPRTEKCRGCGAPIIFVKTSASGKFMPLDVKPERRIFLDKKGLAHSVSVYMPHHATCPNVDQFRKKESSP